jgi:hypothetical protein
MAKRSIRTWVAIALGLVFAAAFVFLFFVPLQGDADFVTKVKQLAGAASINCGRVDESHDPTDALACSQAAIRERKAHLLLVDHQGFDSKVSTGVATDDSGKFHKVSYDSSPCGQLLPTPSCPSRLEASACSSIEYKVAKFKIADASRWQVNVVCGARS